MSSVEEAAHRILEVLQYRPSGLLSDFDGVLSEIAPTPDSAVAFAGAAEAFAAIASTVDVAGIVTGRAVDDVAARFPIGNLVIVGNHGLEWSEQGDRHDHPAGTAAINAIATVLEEVHTEIGKQTDISGFIWENKRLSGTIHFRNAPDPAAMEKLVLPIAQRLAEENGLRCSAGKMVVELRPKAMVTKGTALEEIVEKYGLDGVVFIGDDVTDVDGFHALHALRKQGKHTLAVGVVAADAHPDVAAYADVTVSSVAELVDTLASVGVRQGA